MRSSSTSVTEKRELESEREREKPAVGSEFSWESYAMSYPWNGERRVPKPHKRGEKKQHMGGKDIGNVQMGPCATRLFYTNI